MSGEWRPIETAPKDGTEVQLFWDGLYDGTHGFFGSGFWGFDDTLGNFQGFTHRPIGWLPVAS